MFSVPSISTLSNSIEAAMMERPSVRMRDINLRHSDKVGLTNYLRHEHSLRGATVSIGYRSVTVYFKDTKDTPVVVEAVREFAVENSFTVSESSKRFSLSRFVKALKR